MAAVGWCPPRWVTAEVGRGHPLGVPGHGGPALGRASPVCPGPLHQTGLLTPPSELVLQQLLYVPWHHLVTLGVYLIALPLEPVSVSKKSTRMVSEGINLKSVSNNAAEW